jgi:hypothetical protein
LNRLASPLPQEDPQGKRELPAVAFAFENQSDLPSQIFDAGGVMDIRATDTPQRMPRPLHALSPFAANWSHRILRILQQAGINHPVQAVAAALDTPGS